MSRVRYVGITDDETTCGQCGRVDLARTVVVEWLDDDGNGTGEIAYFGSTCAARALGARGVRVTGRQALAAATVARSRTLSEARDAVATLTHYGLPLTGGATREEILAAAPVFAQVHAHAVWASRTTHEEWVAHVEGMLARRQAAVADAVLIGWDAPVAA